VIDQSRVRILRIQTFITTAAIGPQFFRETAEVINAAADGLHDGTRNDQSYAPQRPMRAPPRPHA
jgi:hypothetical protein